MISFDDLPSVNACLNSASAVFLFSGLYFIKRKNISAHKFCMLAALTVSILFLAGYLTYHFEKGTTRFQAEGWPRILYFSILWSHTALALSLVVLVPITFRRAFKNDLVGHRRIAKWTFPIWSYVSVTGVVVYFMLYHWFAPS